MGSIADATDAELERHRLAIVQEQERRRTLANAESHAAQLNADYLKASGVEQGQEWRQPTNAVDSYPLGWTVTHQGKTWQSMMAGNPYEPGASSWKEVVADGGVPEWVQPTAAHDAYNRGDQVMFEGSVYTSLLDGNVWSPRDYAAGWQRLE